MLSAFAISAFPLILRIVPISWNEIRHNAFKFSREWAGVKSESAEKQTFPLLSATKKQRGHALKKSPNHSTMTH
jgi:hypothetical protein